METPKILITLDTDWAPDCSIELVVRRLVEAEVPAIWLITHQSEATDRLRLHPNLFELGIHPNFLAGSTHGATVSAVLEHCIGLVPEARIMRTHSLVQSTPLLGEVIERTDIKVDLSLFLPYHPSLQPVPFVSPSGSLLRIPTWWEDDFELETPKHLPSVARRLAEPGPGLRVLNFHPIHVALNSSSMAPYRALKEAIPNLRDATEQDIAKRRNGEYGIGDVFSEAIRILKQSGETDTIFPVLGEAAQ